MTDGENAIDLLGHYTDASGGTPDYTNPNANDAPGYSGLNGAYSTVIDSIHHRLFVADYGNNRVLEFDLNVSNQLVDKTPDHVLGQATFHTDSSVSPHHSAPVTQTSINHPMGLAYDSTNSRLFVAQFGDNRVTVYDVANITDGENATNVLGQATFTTNASVTSQSGMFLPDSLAYDTSHSRLFVAEKGSNRVTVYNVAP